jgi:hypothetical protein
MQRFLHRTTVRRDTEPNKTVKNNWIRKTTSNNLLTNPAKFVGNVEGVLRVQLGYFERVRYLATRKILMKLLRIESHHHDNGNVSDRTSMDINLIKTYLSDEI